MVKMPVIIKDNMRRYSASASSSGIEIVKSYLKVDMTSNIESSEVIVEARDGEQ